MTDDLDDLASAYLDGVTSPDEAARVAADPALLARVEELRAVREAMSTVPPADPAHREAAIAAALAAFSEEDEAETEGVAPAATPLTRGAPRRGPSRQVVQLIGAAAAVALLALLVPLLGQLASSSDDTASDSFDSTSSAIGGDTQAEAGADAEETDDSHAATTTLGAAIPDIGAFDDIAGLVESVQDSDEQGAPESAEALGAVDRARAVPEARTAEAEGGSVVAGAATLAGERVVTLLITAPGGARTLLVLRASDCALLDERQL